MNAEQIQELRMAIAEKCGWRKGHWSSFASTGVDKCINGRIWNDFGYSHPDGTVSDNVPNYTADLNAMHDAEKLLKHGNGIYEHTTYREVLRVIVGQNGKIWHATAIQRAEAFCRTLKIGPFSVK